MPAFIDVARGATIFLVCAVLAIAGVSDVRTRRIPNWTVLALMGLFCIWFFVGISVPLLSAFGAALIVFICSFSLFAFGIVGAGDSKLASAVALFAGVNRLPEFIIYMGLAGGVLVLCMMAAEPARALVILQLRGRGALDRGVPYGVAIGMAGAMLLLRTVVHWPF
jgi:prepilin peptidase CpaA